eukprot:TRINITY_DN40967_c0_g1_i1.p1 TRINITY_DN40967_c0_g1~~TRINITY_DN40967_c0_g1_i1.p1  ORF type:complete len:139 (+),score=3.73 TRINITY_DN40967_c0_g1_i1:90-506(+)
MAMHFYASPGPTGAAVFPGPNGNPHLRLPEDFPRKHESRGAPSHTSGTTKLQRGQQHVHDIHADTMLRHQHRALTGSIFGHLQDPPSSVRGGACRRSASSPLVAAGTATAAPLMGTRVGPGLSSPSCTPQNSVRSERP